MTDIELLRKYIFQYGSGQTIFENTLTCFYDAEDVYPWTNEPLKEYYAKDLVEKKVLSVTSSGDHILHAALAGVSEITGFDINRFSKYFAALKVALIKTYSYDEFIKMFPDIDDSHIFVMGHIKTSTADMSDKLLNIYMDSYSYLNEEERIFWEEYFKLYNMSWIPILKDLNKSHHTKNAYSKREEYNKLRYNLSNCKITYIDSNIDSLQDKTKEKFDLMYLSNILGRIDSSDPNVFFNLIKSLQKRLNENGVMYDYNMPSGRWINDLFIGVSPNKLNEILSKELPDFEISDEKLTSGSIYKFKYKGQPK